MLKRRNKNNSIKPVRDKVCSEYQLVPLKLMLIQWALLSVNNDRLHLQHLRFNKLSRVILSATRKFLLHLLWIHCTNAFDGLAPLGVRPRQITVYR